MKSNFDALSVILISRLGLCLLVFFGTLTTACTTRGQTSLPAGTIPLRERLTETKRKGAATVPRLSSAKYRVVWVPDKIEGDEFIEGHRVYIIDDQSKWVTP